MKDCCVASFAAKGVREHFRRAEENEGHTCETCRTVFRYTAAKLWHEEPESGPATMAVLDTTQDDQLDLGWARATRDRARGVLLIQCWGCGGINEVTDRPYVEIHFTHAIGNCSIALAERNRRRGYMPRVH